MQGSLLAVTSARRPSHPPLQAPSLLRNPTIPTSVYR